MLRIYLLGSCQVFDGDQPLPLPTPDKVLELWSYLLLRRQRPVFRDKLAGLLWPEVTEGEARANLRRHLYLLRKQLPQPSSTAPWILTTRNTTQWNPDADYWLDVALLDQFDGGTADEWTEVIDSYRGYLLDGFYQDWVLAERARLSQRYLRILEQRIAQQKTAGDLPGAIRVTQRLLAHDFLREEPYRHLMELYYRAGDRAAALRSFEECRAMLQSELEVEPMPETLALRDAIVNGENLTPLPDSVPTPPRPRLPAPTSRPPQQRKPKWWLGVGALLVVLLTWGLFATGVVSWNAIPAEPVTISMSGPAVTQDTWLNGETTPDLPYDPDYPDDGYAVYPQIHLQYFSFPYDRVLIRFDLQQIPSDAAIEQAIFNLHLESFINQDLLEPLPATVSAFRVLVPWRPDTVTFNSPWSRPGMASGVDYAPQPSGSYSIHGTDWVSIDVTDMAREWLAHPDENFGMVVMITQAPQGAHYWVDTSDYPLTDRQPRFDVAYIP